MGEGKRRKERLGDWYGRPVTKGHPDFVEPRCEERSAYDSTSARISTHAKDADVGRPERVAAVIGAADDTTSPTVPSEEKRPEPERTAVVVGEPETYVRADRRMSGLALMALVSTLTAGIDLGPPPQPRRKRRP